MKINVGDVIELHELTVVHIRAGTIIVECAGDKRIVVQEGAIKAVKPPPPKVGDWVTWGLCTSVFEIVAIKGDTAILYNALRDGARTKKLSELTRVEKPE